ncbi:hypothetical protein [Flavobacterium fluviale]|uniref:Uncharacterized protein n=1 Tax=Flavobacterium fluviale TaxID=2249356 RepID=A0A344LV01_9FLAO|nr:hypothetical protein [Flavobacterium fluviale]AXB57743.1 hypothetical protein HYN86_14510 [Flavobacterium fluviale]
MNTIYPLEWLDYVILQILNPNKSNVTILTKTEVTLITENIVKEANHIQVRMKNEIFSLVKKRQIRLQVRKYHSNLIYLLDSAVENQQCKELKKKDLAKVIELTISTLDELLSFVENRFSNFLSLDERVPITYLAVTRKELIHKIAMLEKRPFETEKERSTIDIIKDALSESVQISHNKASFRQILYERQLMNRLLETSYLNQSLSIFSALDKILIETNFNSKRYIDFLIDNLSENTSLIEDANERLNFLMCNSKELNQLYSNENVTFNPATKNIKSILLDWFSYEAAYLESQINAEHLVSEQLGKSNDKVECILSTDQMALILRASDESRVLKARSMNLVFKTIVPFLSTPFKKDLSYQSVRSKSYNAEDRDKEIAIQTLKKIIEKIKTY